jgi:TPR repeat protein
MKRLLCAVLLAVAASVALADDLADANRLLQAKAYDKALPLYQRLADAGNPEAQFRLGEMYWFGDGTKADMAKARQWFEKSAAAGNADAAASLASLKRRETHGGEIAYWTTTYQGEDLVSGQYACQRPAFPAAPKTPEEIRTVDKAIAAWRACYNARIDHINDALPPGKRIPAETLDMMTPAEAGQAQRHLDGVYSKSIADARQEAALFAADEEKWKQAAREYAEKEKVRLTAIKAELERQQQYQFNGSDAVRSKTVPAK